jgi:hypothetical protein
VKLILLLAVTTTSIIDALSITDASAPKPRGCAATPLQKKKIVVVGAGGYLGAVVFGFLQRASNLYGTGMGSSPRNICATAVSAKLMNGVLSKNFVLAYAGEEHMRLTNGMDKTAETIAARLKGYKGVILGTVQYLEQRPVTAGSYEKTPNDKVWEFYLDRPRREGAAGVTVTDEKQLVELNLQLFSNLLQACQQAQVEHVVVVETPATTTPQAFGDILKECQVPFTYVRLDSELANFPGDHTYIKGLQGDVLLESIPITTGTADWIQQLDPPKQPGLRAPLYREDLAAVLVQSLQSLDWSTSRCLRVCSNGALEGARAGDMKGRYDREWCGNQDVLAQKFAALS